MTIFDGHEADEMMRDVLETAKFRETPIQDAIDTREAYPWTFDVFTDANKIGKITNAYGILLQSLGKPPDASGESLAIRANFPDRIVRVHWSGEVEVEHLTKETP